MALETTPSFITAQDARPYFGVDPETQPITETQITSNHLGFIAVCRLVVTSGINIDTSRRLFTQTELAEYIDSFYSDGYIEVDVYETEKNGMTVHDVYVTHRVMHRDEDDDEEYLGWKRQSIYEIDDAGILIRTDRMPPTLEEEMMAALSYEKLNEAFPLPDNSLSPKLSSIDGMSQEEIKEVIRRLVAESTRKIEQINASNKAHKVQREDEIQAEQRSRDMMKAFGFNEQPVRPGEFKRLAELICHAYGLSLPEGIYF